MNQTLIRQLEIEAQRQLLFALAIAAIWFAVTMWILYIVIKSAIRDGIQESGLVDRWQMTVAQVQRVQSPMGDTDIRADR